MNDRLELLKFGLELMSESAVEDVQRDCHDKGLRDLCMKLLEKWKASKDKPTWDDVIRALREVNQRELAQTIEEALKGKTEIQAPKPARLECVRAVHHYSELCTRSVSKSVLNCLIQILKTWDYLTN